MAALKKMILIVEDEEGLREALKLKLEQADYEVLAASTGEEALEILKSRRPDMVSLDILLPGINGLEVLQKIRDDSKLHNLPVIILSVSGSQEKIQQAFSMNVVDYLIKSEHKIDGIITKFKKILGKHS
jgi:DNA-binding response OmpR family regulator